MKADKTPKIDGYPNRFLKVLRDPLAEIITTVTNACWEHGHYPKRFRETRSIALKKADKQGKYHFPRNWKPIALLNTISKIIKAAITARLQNAADAYNLLSDS